MTRYARWLSGGHTHLPGKTYHPAVQVQLGTWYMQGAVWLGSHWAWIKVGK